MPWTVWNYNIRIHNVGSMRKKDFRESGQVVSAVFVVKNWNGTTDLHGSR